MEEHRSWHNKPMADKHLNHFDFSEGNGVFKKLNESVKWSESYSVVSNSSQPHGLYSPWNSPARILEWVAFPFSRGSPQPRERTQVSHIAGRLFISWVTREAHSDQMFTDRLTTIYTMNNSAIKRNQILTYATMWALPEDLMLRKQARHRRADAGWFHWDTVSIAVRFVDSVRIREVAREWGEGRMKSYCFMGTKFQIGKLNRFWGLAAQRCDVFSRVAAGTWGIFSSYSGDVHSKL